MTTIFGKGFYCCLCFRPLIPEECNITMKGDLEDVCHECAELELKYLASHLLDYHPYDEIWCIIDSRTEQRVSVAAFINEEGAKRQIESWIERDKRGGRPDCHESIPYLVPKRIS